MPVVAGCVVMEFFKKNCLFPSIKKWLENSMLKSSKRNQLFVEKDHFLN